MKILGRDLKRFYREGWPGDGWYEEEGGIDDLDGLGDGEIVDSGELGYIEWQGGGEAPTRPGRGLAVESLYRKWKKQLTVESLLIEFDVALEADVRSALKAAGAKVIA